MNLDELKAACRQYYAATETKETESGILYKTVAAQGIRHFPLGYFPTEERAVQALYDYVSMKKLV